MDSEKNIPAQRALVLQGGGSIGAYEAGVFNVLYHWIQKDIQDKKDENIFDIVAGTSIGAANGAILVSFVQQNKTWEGASTKLLQFWDNLASTPDLYSWWPFWNNWVLPWNENFWIDTWNYRNDDNSQSATGEAARRYYSAKDFILYGAPNVFSKPQRIYDDRFLDNFGFPSNVWYVYDNKPLRDSIKKSVSFPIATRYYDLNKQQLKQPRLLTVSVDVEEGETVVFDSYHKKDGSWSTEYEQDSNSGESQKQSEGNIKVSYNEGLMVEHILASSSIPIHYDYTYVPITYDYDKNISDEDRDKKLKQDLQQPDTIIRNYRRFWDGGITSNTPLREMIQSHQDYWRNVENVEEIPDLEVYVVDVWPSMEDKNYPIIPDHDSTVNRKNGLIYQDKTPYEEKVANIVSDYYTLSTKLLNLAEKLARDNEEAKKVIKDILDDKGKSAHRSGGPRKYRSLLEDRFDIKRLIRIERSGDPDDISNKWCDSSKKTIDGLIKQGIEDALNTLVDDIRKSKAGDPIDDINRFIEDHINRFIAEVKDRNLVHNRTMVEIADVIKKKLQTGDNIGKS